MNELDLPEHRALPEAVRDRIRDRVMGELVKRPNRWLRWPNGLRPPLAVAASVSVLAAGAVIVAQSVGGSGGDVGATPPPTPITTGATLNHQEADGELDRCWEAMRRQGRQFPPRSHWQPVFNYDYNRFQVKMVAARADDKPLFCETTHTTATVSDPNATPAYAAGTRTGTVLTTRLGTIAGVVDPSWQGVWSKGSDDQAEWQNVTIVKDGLFLILPDFKTSRDEVDVTEAPPEGGSPGTWLPLPRATTEDVSLVDRPAVPPPDRVSTRGQRLDNCLSAAAQTTAVVDPASWGPGAMLQTGNDYLMLARNVDGFAACWQVNGKTSFDGYRALREAADKHDPASMETIVVPGGLILAGTVPQNCVRMQVLMAKAGTVEADVANATFAVLIPPSDLSSGKSPNVKLFDKNNTMIYEGQLN
jgi:hypothetical protein